MKGFTAEDSLQNTAENIKIKMNNPGEAKEDEEVFYSPSLKMKTSYRKKYVKQCCGAGANSFV